MKTVIVSSSKHNTAGKLIYDKNLSVFNNIVNITAHYTTRLDCLIDMMKQCCIFHIHKVFNAENLLCLFYTALCKCCCFSFFINYIVAVICFLSVLLFVHLSNLNHCKGFGKVICSSVHICWLIALAADNKRGSCLIDKNWVNLVNNGKSVLSLHLLFFVLHHIVTKIVKSHLVVCAVSNVAVICFFSFIVWFFMNNKPCWKTEKTI